MQLSIIIPVYKVEKYIAQCLESIVYQTFTDMEILVIDDGSTDGSLKICQDYARQDPRIRIIKQKNAGVSAARNRGLDLARGEYVHFIDSDDYLADLDMYRQMIDAATKNDCDMAVCGFYFQERPYQSIEYKSSGVYVGLDNKLRITAFFDHGYIWRYLFKRDFLIKNHLKFEVGQTIFEDCKFGLSAIEQANKIVTVPDVSYFYRYRPDSRIGTSKHSKDDKKKYQKLMKFYESFARTNQCEDVLKNKFQKTTYKTVFNLNLMTVMNQNTVSKFYLFGLVRILKKAQD